MFLLAGNVDIKELITTFNPDDYFDGKLAGLNSISIGSFMDLSSDGTIITATQITINIKEYTGKLDEDGLPATIITGSGWDFSVFPYSGTSTASGSKGGFYWNYGSNGKEVKLKLTFSKSGKRSFEAILRFTANYQNVNWAVEKSYEWSYFEMLALATGDEKWLKFS